MPIAVMSGASLGALRSGRYATRSIMTLSEPLASIDTARKPTIERMIRPVPVSASTPAVAQRPTATNEPIMNTSPWAKLMSSMMP